jgi:hypothetical protein
MMAGATLLFCSEEQREIGCLGDVMMIREA